jgi:DNA polymerase III psi subunit
MHNIQQYAIQIRGLTLPKKQELARVLSQNGETLKPHSVLLSEYIRSSSCYLHYNRDEDYWWVTDESDVQPGCTKVHHTTFLSTFRKLHTKRRTYA